MRHLSLARRLALTVSASALATLSGQTNARAGSGPSVIVPKIASAPLWNTSAGCRTSGTVANPSSSNDGWGQGVVVPFNATAKATIVRTDTDLWICVSGVEPNSTGADPSSNDAVGINLDTLHSQTTNLSDGDILMQVLATGRTTVSATAYVGSITSAVPLPASDYDAFGAEIQDFEFSYSWHVAVRLGKHALGDRWQTIGAAMSEAGTGNETYDADWPTAGVEGSPALWGNLVLDDGIAPLPSPESFFPNYGNAPQLGRAGDTVTIYGRYLDAIASVYFQNDDLTLAAQDETDMVAPILSRSSTSITVQIPRLAVTGSLKLHTSDGRVFSPPGFFTVNSYRNTWGYRFHNWDVSGPDDITLGDVTDVFGKDQMFWLGFIPSLEALALYGLGVSFLTGHGHCYGMSFTSLRMRAGDQPLSPFDAVVNPPRVVFDLAGADNGNVPHALAHHIAGWHFVQFSTENLRLFMQNSANGRLNPAFTKGVLTSETSHNNPVLLVTRQPTKGHVIVAYDVVDVTSGPNAGGYDIRTYDNDVQYNPGSEEQPSGGDHASNESKSTVHVWPDGTWSHESTHSYLWTGGPGDLVAEPYSQLPQHPTLPWTIDGVFSIALGDAGTIQLSDDAGHTLLNPDGTENTVESTRIPNATRFVPDSGDSALNGDTFVALTHTTLHQTIAGKTNGTYTHMFMGRGVVGKLDGLTAISGASDDVRFETNTGTLDFRTGTASKSLAAQLVGRTADAERSIAVRGATSVAGGADVLRLDGARNAPSYAHSGSTTFASVTLQQNDGAGAKTFAAHALRFDDGDTATFTPANWASLDTTTVDLVVRHKDGKTTHKVLHNEACEDSDGEDCGGVATYALGAGAIAPAASDDVATQEKGGCSTARSTARGSGWMGLGLAAAMAWVRRRNSARRRGASS